MILKVSAAEKEILRCLVNATETGPDEVSFIFIGGAGLPDFTKRLDEAIERQGDDMGDWQRHKEWREARPGLIEKIRKASFGIVPDNRPERTWA